MAQLLECLPSMHKAQGVIPSTTQKSGVMVHVCNPSTQEIEGSPSATPVMRPAWIYKTVSKSNNKVVKKKLGVKGDCSFVASCPDPNNHTKTILISTLFGI